MCSPPYCFRLNRIAPRYAGIDLRPDLHLLNVECPDAYSCSFPASYHQLSRPSRDKTASHVGKRAFDDSATP